MKVLNINLTNEEKMMLEDELVGIEYPTNNYDLYILEMNKVLYKYRTIFKDAIANRNLSFDKSGYSVIKFTNLPQDNNIQMPPTNYNHYTRIKKESYISENILVLIGLIFGEPYTMFDEGKGLVNNIIPLKKSTKNYTGEGSGVELGFHIENNALRYFSYGDCSPKCLLLEGVKQQDTPPIYINI